MSEMYYRLELMAKTLAYMGHHGQMTRFGDIEPTIQHVERVVKRCQGEARVVAWLHDLIEDTPAFRDDPAGRLLAAGFPNTTVVAVLLLTRGWHTPLTVPYEEYIKYLGQSKNALAIEVKIADLTDNLRPGCPPKHQERYEHSLAYLQAVLAVQVSPTDPTLSSPLLETRGLPVRCCQHGQFTWHAGCPLCDPLKR